MLAQLRATRLAGARAALRSSLRRRLARSLTTSAHATAVPSGATATATAQPSGSALLATTPSSVLLRPATLKPLASAKPQFASPLIPKRAFSTEHKTPAQIKAEFLAKQKASGVQWGAFSGNKNESTLSKEDQAKLKADEANAAAATAGTATASATTDSAGASDAAAGAATATATAPPQPRKSFAERLKDEIRYAKEFMGSGPEATASGLQKYRLKRGEDVQKLLAQKPVSNIEANTEVNALVIVEQTKPKWEERLESIKGMLRASAPMRGGRKVKHALQTSENPLVERARNAHQALRDRVEDWRNVYDESQHPMVWKLRDVQDKLTTETDAAYALGVLTKLDPTFDIERFVKDMEHYMIPLVIDAYLAGDDALLGLVSEGNARTALKGMLKARRAGFTKWDTRTLDLHSVEFKQVVMFDNQPYVEMSFMCQHVEHHTDSRDGKTIKGHSSNITNAVYAWVVKRDFENPFFDWTIVEFQTHVVHALV